MAVRIRVSLLTPFPPAKLLLLLPADVELISDLKKHLFRSLSAIAHHATTAKQLRLEIEGFELLGGSNINIIRAEDVVCVTLAPESSIAQPASKKRTVSALFAASPNKTARTHHSLPAMTAPVASVTAVPSPSSVSDESSETSSSSSSAEDGSSSSISSSSGSVSPSLPIHPAFPVLQKSPLPTAVPPGLGKAATQIRNLRRRRAKQFLKEAVVDPNAPHTGLSPSAGHRNDLTPETASITTPGAPSMPVPQSLTNKNKRKGFMQEMLGVKGQRTVFGPGEGSPNGEMQANGKSTPAEAAEAVMLNGLATARLNSHSTPSSSRITQRLVPPSEQTGLPSNVFVTSAEFDWRTPRSTKRRRDDDDGEVMIEDTLNRQDRVYDVKTVVEAQIDMSENTSQQALMWEKVGVAFDYLDNLTSESISSLQAGAIVAWKSLELDLFTLSPELKLSLGRLRPDQPWGIRLDKMVRPLRIRDEGMEGEGGGDAPEEEAEIVFISDTDLQASAGHWKLVPPTMMT